MFLQRLALVVLLFQATHAQGGVPETQCNMEDGSSCAAVERSLLQMKHDTSKNVIGGEKPSKTKTAEKGTQTLNAPEDVARIRGPVEGSKDEDIEHGEKKTDAEKADERELDQASKEDLEDEQGEAGFEDEEGEQTAEDEEASKDSGDEDEDEEGEEGLEDNDAQDTVDANTVPVDAAPPTEGDKGHGPASLVVKDASSESVACEHRRRVGRTPCTPLRPSNSRRRHIRAGGYARRRRTSSRPATRPRPGPAPRRRTRPAASPRRRRGSPGAVASSKYAATKRCWGIVKASCKTNRYLTLESCRRSCNSCCAGKVSAPSIWDNSCQNNMRACHFIPCRSGCTQNYFKIYRRR